MKKRMTYRNYTINYDELLKAWIYSHCDTGEEYEGYSNNEHVGMCETVALCMFEIDSFLEYKRTRQSEYAENAYFDNKERYNAIRNWL